MDFLFGHNMFLRGEDGRSHLFTFEIDEGPTPCWPLIIMMKCHQGKTNAFARREYMGVMRHKDPMLCTMSQAAFYLFDRREIMNEPVPRFYQRQMWYDMHFFRGKDILEELSYRSSTGF